MTENSGESQNNQPEILGEKIYELAKRRGFFYPSNEIYGGLTGFYDYGSTGVLLKRNLENLWRMHFLRFNDNSFELEPSQIMPEPVFIASGHIKNFIDPSVRCKKEGIYYRADHIISEATGENAEGKKPEELERLITERKIRCPKCGGELGEVKVLNMMLQVKLGAEGDTIAYLRPETAQGVYVNFLRQFNIQRGKLPMGLAIIGKAFRNEISPRQLLIRQREFTQAELQTFIDPSEIESVERWDDIKNYQLRLLYSGKDEIQTFSCEDIASSKKIPKFYVYCMAKMQQFFIDILGFPPDKFRLRELSQEERAFYNRLHFDSEVYLESLGEYKEVGGIHYRTDHDLNGHAQISKKSHEILYNGRRFVPHVVELTVGIDRVFYSIMELFYNPKSVKREWEWMAFPRRLSPFQFAVYPLVNKDGIPESAIKVAEKLKKRYEAFYDYSGSIGKRYARADEIGIPFSITIDYQTLEDNTVTIRDRDTTLQSRVRIEELEAEAGRLLGF